MNKKSGLKDMGGILQFFFLWFLLFAGMMLGAILLISFNLTDIWESTNIMRMSLFIQTISIFLIPALLFAYLTQDNIKTYLKTEEKTSLRFIVLSILLIIVVQPIIYTLSYYNHQLTLPESMASLEQWIIDSEATAEKMYNMLFSDKSMVGLLMNLFVIAIVAGLAEEFFFRGCLQQIINKIISNKHVMIWVTAFIFSFIHFQFYGFIPRLLLGGILGYLFFWSENIWIPVIAHTANNSFNIIMSYLYYGTPVYNQLENFEITNYIWYITISFILFCLTLTLIYKSRAIRKEK